MPEKSNQKISDKEREILLIEYQKAQDSAEHHDTLLWTVSGIVFAALTAFFQSIATNIWASLLGIVLLFALWIFNRSFRYYKQKSYERCKEIEKILGMKHHLMKERFCIGQWEILLFLLIVFGFVYAHIFYQNLVPLCKCL